MATKGCVACAEQIQQNAKLCRFCGTMQDDGRFQSQAQEENSAPEVVPAFEPFWDESNDEFKVCSSCGTHASPYAYRCENCDAWLHAGDGRFWVTTPPPPKTKEVSQLVETVSLGPTPGVAIAAVICAFLVPILGLILGYAARNEIRNPNNPKEGESLATAAIVIGWIWIIGIAAYVVLVTAGVLTFAWQVTH